MLIDQETLQLRQVQEFGRKSYGHYN